MKKIITPLLTVFTCWCLFAQSPTNTENWMSSKTYTDYNNQYPASDITYYDGFGRPIQTISINAGGQQTGNSDKMPSIITPVYYDGANRPTRSYLPYASSNNTGAYEQNAFTQQTTYYQARFPKDYQYAFSENILSLSPLNRIEAVFMPGAVYKYQDKATLYEYNSNSNDVKRFCFSDSAGEITFADNYEKNTLFMNSVTNEDGTATITFKNSSDKIVLERTAYKKNGYGEKLAETYYVYDDYDRLSWVISPEGVRNIETLALNSLSVDDNIVKQYCYVYEYDSRDRCIAKRIPGSDWIYMVYDKADRLILVQDGNQRLRKEWTYSVYDNLDRLLGESIVFTTTNFDRHTIRRINEEIDFYNGYPYWGDNVFVLKKHTGIYRYDNYNDNMVDDGQSPDELCYIYFLSSKSGMDSNIIDAYLDFSDINSSDVDRLLKGEPILLKSDIPYYLAKQHRDSLALVGIDILISKRLIEIPEIKPFLDGYPSNYSKSYVSQEIFLLVDEDLLTRTGNVGETLGYNYIDQNDNIDEAYKIMNGAYYIPNSVLPYIDNAIEKAAPGAFILTNTFPLQSEPSEFVWAYAVMDVPVSSSVFLKVNTTNLPPPSEGIGHYFPNEDYLTVEGHVNESFYIHDDNENPNIKYYYVSEDIVPYLEYFIPTVEKYNAYYVINNYPVPRSPITLSDITADWPVNTDVFLEVNENKIDSGMTGFLRLNFPSYFGIHDSIDTKYLVNTDLGDPQCKYYCIPKGLEIELPDIIEQAKKYGVSGYRMVSNFSDFQNIPANVYTDVFLRVKEHEIDPGMVGYLRHQVYPYIGAGDVINPEYYIGYDPHDNSKYYYVPQGLEPSLSHAIATGAGYGVPGYYVVSEHPLLNGSRYGMFLKITQDEIDPDMVGYMRFRLPSYFEDRDNVKPEYYLGYRGDSKYYSIPGALRSELSQIINQGIDGSGMQGYDIVTSCPLFINNAQKTVSYDLGDCEVGREFYVRADYSAIESADESMKTAFGSFYSYPPSSYIHYIYGDGTINNSFFIGNDPSNSKIKYFYFPNTGYDIAASVIRSGRYPYTFVDSLPEEFFYAERKNSVLTSWTSIEDQMQREVSPPESKSDLRYVSFVKGKYLAVEACSGDIPNSTRKIADPSGKYFINEFAPKPEYYICTASRNELYGNSEYPVYVNFYYIPDECMSIVENTIALQSEGENYYLLMDFCPTELARSRGTYVDISSIVPSYEKRVKGLKTYEKVAVIKGDEIEDDYVERVFYYDYKGRVIQVDETNHLGGSSCYITEYDFIGNIILTEEYHSYPGCMAPDVKTTEFVYDNRGRLLSEKAVLNFGEPAIVQYGYDELGQLVNKTYGSGENKITEEMKYNIQGWMTKQSSEVFDMSLHYYDPIAAKEASYSGNITEWGWQHKSPEQGSTLVNTALSEYIHPTNNYTISTNTFILFNPSYSYEYKTYIIEHLYPLCPYYFTETGDIRPEYLIKYHEGYEVYFYYIPEECVKISECIGRLSYAPYFIFGQRSEVGFDPYKIQVSIPNPDYVAPNTLHVKENMYYGYLFSIQGALSAEVGKALLEQFPGYFTDIQGAIDPKYHYGGNKYYIPDHYRTLTAATALSSSIQISEVNNGVQYLVHTSDVLDNVYAFTYDKLSRLVDTDQYVGGAKTNSFVERDLSYDKNGNFLTLQRYANGAIIDSIGNATYNGNQIATIGNNGASCSYAYDANGNCTTDGLNALKLEYNYLNLTSAARDMSDNPLATYRWLADGTKTGVADDSGMGYEYLGSLIYRRNSDGLELESAAFGGGRIMVSEGSSGMVYTPNYFITDHLGSTRVVVKPGESGMEIVERNDYYAFGGKHENPQLAVSDNRFRFSGKEDQTTGNLPYQDFGARFFGKKLPIWTSIDPLAEKYYSISPYAYCLNNPVIFIDPDGQDIWIVAGDQVLKYANNKLWQYDSKNKEYIQYTGDNEFALNAKQTLNNIIALDDPEVNYVMNTLETDSEVRVMIYEGKQQGSGSSLDGLIIDEGTDGAVRQGTDIIVGLNFENTQTASKEGLLTHEMSHAYDNYIGRNGSNEKKFEDANGRAALSHFEDRAVKLENKTLIRQGISPKTSYSGYPLRRDLKPAWPKLLKN